MSLNNSIGCLKGSDTSAFEATSAEQYEKMASEFLISPLRGNGTLQKIRGNGDIARYDPKSGEFGVLTNSFLVTHEIRGAELRTLCFQVRHDPTPETLEALDFILPARG
ncbi:hypothetical protein [Arthrobacter sp. Hiyo1]|uniref:hypothetical protein n=1 Tax=Arthrobacter sp. Hiyo1 TaxID=1588020 RepID=UPI000750D38C|nr:hypothetical protein [Arthrobacter sp. Hiyo1]